VLLGFLVLWSLLQTVVIIALVVGAWWVIRGVLDIVEGASGAAVDRGLNIALGVISVVAGAIVLLQPQLSLKVFAIVLGVWMVLYGVILVISSILLKPQPKPVAAPGKLPSARDAILTCGLPRRNRLRRSSCDAA